MAQLIELHAELLHVVGEASGRVHRILGRTAGTDLHARHTWQRHRSHSRPVDRPERGGAQAALRTDLLVRCHVHHYAHLLAAGRSDLGRRRTGDELVAATHHAEPPPSGGRPVLGLPASRV